MQVSLRTSPGGWQLLTHGPPGVVSQEPISPLALLAAMLWSLPAVTCHGRGSDLGSQGDIKGGASGLDLSVQEGLRHSAEGSSDSDISRTGRMRMNVVTYYSVPEKL